VPEPVTDTVAVTDAVIGGVSNPVSTKLRRTDNDNGNRLGLEWPRRIDELWIGHDAK
jgi:hypothetical protein